MAIVFGTWQWLHAHCDWIPLAAKLFACRKVCLVLWQRIHYVLGVVGVIDVCSATDGQSELSGRQRANQ